MLFFRTGAKRVLLGVGALLTTGCALLRDYSTPMDEAVVEAPSVNWIARGDSAYAREEFAQSVVWYREAAHSGQQEAVAWFNAANAMVRLDRNEEAAEAYRRSIRAAPDFLKAHQNLAALHHLAGDVADAARHYEVAARLDSTDANARHRLGELADQVGERGEALRWYERTLAVEPGHEGAASGIVQVLLAVGDTAAALVWMDHYNSSPACTARPVSWALMLQADLALAVGQQQEGIRLYQEAAAVAPSDTRPWLRMARVLRDADRPLEAAVAVNQGLAADSGRGELWAALGALRLEGGDPVGAREAFVHAFRLGSVEGVRGLEMLAAWHERRLEPAAAAAIRDMLGIKP